MAALLIRPRKVTQIIHISLSLSLYPSLSLSSDNVIPHWSDDIMPCPVPTGHHTPYQQVLLQICYTFFAARTQYMYLISPLYHSKHWIVFRVCSYMALFCDNLLLVLPYLPFTYMLIIKEQISPSLPHSSLCSIYAPPPPLASLVWTSCNTWMVGTPTSLLLTPRKDLLQCVSWASPCSGQAVFTGVIWERTALIIKARREWIRRYNAHTHTHTHTHCINLGLIYQQWWIFEIWWGWWIIQGDMETT